MLQCQILSVCSNFKYDEKPEVGDLIEIFRGSYQHWAVYVGDGFIVHLAPPCESPRTTILAATPKS